MSSSGVTGDLRAQGPLEVLDGALSLVRNAGAARLTYAWLAAMPLALCALSTYYLERVEGIHTLRPLLAVSFVVAFWARALLLSKSAREYVLAMPGGTSLPLHTPRAVDIVSTASVVGIGLFVWLWPLAGAALLSPLSVAGVLPIVALRGAVAPSWLARAACEPQRGLSAFGQALDDTGGMRSVFLIVEMLVLFGAIGLCANLYALLGLVLLLGHALLGLDVAFVSSFLSPDNAFVLLFVAVLTLIALEPLRAAISAQAFVNARTRRDGADLHAAVDAAIEGRSARVRRAAHGVTKASSVWLVLGGMWLCAPSAHAQAPLPPTTPDAPPPSAPNAHDDDVRARLQEILAQQEFREFAEGDTRSMRQLLDRFFAWLDHLGDDARQAQAAQPKGRSKLSAWVLFALVAAALIGLGLLLRQQRRRGQDEQEVAAAAPSSAVPPPSPFDEAARYAAQGDARTALRFLYVAALGTLDRRGLIDYEPSKTNWQYLRNLPESDVREAFAMFTRIFDHTWYGHAPATQADYEQCRSLCDRICQTDAS